jgi:hypothetical protein
VSIRFVALLIALLSAALVASCARYMPSELHQLCLRTERLGYLWGRNVMANDAGAEMLLHTHPHSHRGRCVPSMQGSAQGLEVCLVKSTECGKDRHTRVWDDQWERYQDKYPGSFMCMDQREESTCQECIQEPDDCFTGLGSQAETSCLQYDRECSDRFIEPDTEPAMGGRRQ